MICVDSFKPTQNRNSPGGVDQLNAQTLPACETICRNNADCVGFDFDISSNIKCFTHNAASFTTKNTVTGVFQYAIERCGSVTVSPSKSSPHFLIYLDIL